MFSSRTIDLARQIKDVFDRTGLTLALAESCTGGLIGAAITEIPGSSSFFHGSAGVYSNDAKTLVLSVPARDVSAYGAVSSRCALAMAEGAQTLYDVDLALSVTGIAGPDGGSAEKPVGLVWFAVAGRNLRPRSFSRLFSGDRSAVRMSAVDTALETILKESKENVGGAEVGRGKEKSHD